MHEDYIRRWTEMYCQRVLWVDKIYDKYRIWMGAWQVGVVLKTNARSLDGVAHLPSVIQVGAHQEFINYFGQPKKCKMPSNDLFSM